MIVTYPPPLRFCRISLAIRFEQSLVAHHQAHHCLVCLVSLGSAMHGATHDLTCSDNLCFLFFQNYSQQISKIASKLGAGLGCEPGTHARCGANISLVLDARRSCARESKNEQKLCTVTTGEPPSPNVFVDQAWLRAQSPTAAL